MSEIWDDCTQLDNWALGDPATNTLNLDRGLIHVLTGLNWSTYLYKRPLTTLWNLSQKPTMTIILETDEPVKPTAIHLVTATSADPYAWNEFTYGNFQTIAGLNQITVDLRTPLGGGAPNLSLIRQLLLVLGGDSATQQFSQPRNYWLHGISVDIGAALLPKISVSPASGRVYLHGSLTLTATPLYGMPPYLIEWYVNGMAVGTGNTFLFVGNQLDNYNIMAKVTDSIGAIATSTATITVINQAYPKPIVPLATNGRWIVNAASPTEKVTLFGVWCGGMLVSTAGQWPPVGGDPNSGWETWDEANIRKHFQAMIDSGINKISVFLWADWWLNNAYGTLYEPSKPLLINDKYRDTVVKLVGLAYQYGLYVELRLWSTKPSAWGGRDRVTMPIYPTDNYFGADLATSIAGFASFWSSVASVLKTFDNVILHLFDEPTEDGGNTMNQWFQAAEAAIAAIRVTGFAGLIGLHWFYCAGVEWIDSWVNYFTIKGLPPPNNVIYSAHIFRSSGTYRGTGPDYQDAPTDIATIRNFLLNIRLYGHVLNDLKLPLYVGSVGMRSDWTGQAYADELTAFINTLAVLDELNMNFTGYRWENAGGWEFTYVDSPFTLTLNNAGITFTNAITATQPPIAHTLSISSFPIQGIQFTLNGAAKITPYTEALYEGNYAMVMPSNLIIGSDTYNFTQWSDGGTSPTKTINLVADATLMAIYQLQPPPPLEKGNIEVHAFLDAQEVVAPGSVVETSEAFNTPATLTENPGIYVVKVTIGSETKQQIATVASGQTVRLDFQFTTPPPTSPISPGLILGGLIVGGVILSSTPK